MNPVSYAGAAKGIRFLVWPVRLVTMVLVLEGILLFACFQLALFSYSWSKKLLLQMNRKSREERKNRKYSRASIVFYEFQKLMRYSGGTVICLLLLSVQMFVWKNESDFVYPYEYYYSGYLERFGGEITQEKWEEILAEYSDIHYSELENKLMKQAEAGEITEEYMIYRLSNFTENSYQIAALDAVIEQYTKIEAINEGGKNAAMINTIPWSNLLGNTGFVKSMSIWIETLIAIVLLFSIYGVFEKQSGVDVLISVSAIGSKCLFRKKLVPVFSVSILLSLIGIIPRILFLFRRYNYAVSAQRSVSSWLLINIPDWFLLVELCFIAFLLYITVNLIIALLCVIIAGRMKNISSALLVNSILFCSIPLGILFFVMNKGTY